MKYNYLHVFTFYFIFLVLVENTCISSLTSLYDSGEMTLVLASHLFGVRLFFYNSPGPPPELKLGKSPCFVFLLPSFWSVPWFSKVTFLLTHRFACCVLLVRCFTIPMFPHIPTSLYTSFWPWINPTWAPYFDLLGHWELYNFQKHQSGTRNSRSSPQIPFNNSRLYPPNPHSPDFWHSKVIQCYTPKWY